MHRILLSTVVAAAVSYAFGGAFSLEFGNPSATHDPLAKNALLTVRAVGCANPALAKVSATAEGKVAGKRQSIPLTVTPLGTPGMHALKADLPKEGVWVLAVTGAAPDGRTASAIVPMGQNGPDRFGAKVMNGALPPEQLEARLK